MRNELRDGVLGEALRCKVTRCLNAPAARLDHCIGPRRLGLELGDHCADGVGGNAVAIEIVGDEEIACSAAGKKHCPVRGVPLIIHESRALHRLDRLSAHGASGATVGKTLLE